MFRIYIRLDDDDVVRQSARDAANRSCELNDEGGFRLCRDVRRKLENLGCVVSTDPNEPHLFELRVRTSINITVDGAGEADSEYTSDVLPAQPGASTRLSARRRRRQRHAIERHAQSAV